MQLPLSALASWFSTFSLQFIGGSFNHRPIREKRFNNLPDLVGESSKGLPKLAELFLICGCLYAHIYISIQILVQKARKKWLPSKKNCVHCESEWLYGVNDGLLRIYD